MVISLFYPKFVMPEKSKSLRVRAKNLKSWKIKYSSKSKDCLMHLTLFNLYENANCVWYVIYYFLGSIGERN